MFIRSLVFILYAWSVSAFLEVLLQRKQEEYSIDVWKIASAHPKVKKCPKEILEFRYNTTAITQMCFHNDLAYTIETLIGDIKFNYEITAIGIDLHSPVSWLKSTECKSCPNSTAIPTFKNASKLNCSISCLFNEEQSDFVVTKKYKQKKSSSIFSNKQYMFGEYILSKFSFLAYDPEKKKTMLRYIQEQLERDNFEKYEDLISFPSLKMIAASTLIGYEKYPADGGIGLGMNQIYNGKTNFESNTDIMEALSSAEQEINSRVFGIYINDMSLVFKDYALILGGINYKYSEKQMNEVQYVKVIDNSSYYWNIPVQKITFHIPSAKINMNGVSNPETFRDIIPQKKSGIISLNTSFIALPKESLEQLVAIINRHGQADCKIVDLTYLALYCINIHTEQIQTMELIFQLEGGVEISLDYRHLLRKCKVDPDFSSDDFNMNDCLLNIQLSPTDNIILGEPFLKGHYTIFDQDNKQVGFLPAAQSPFWHSDFYQETSFVRYLIRVVVVIFVLGITFILCIAQIMKIYKWIISKTNSDIESHPSEKLSFVNQSHDLSYDELELATRQQTLDDLKKEQDNENSTTSFQNDSYLANEGQQQSNFPTSINDFPEIPKPPSKIMDLIEVQSIPTQPTQELAFDHGFNFVSNKNIA